MKRLQATISGKVQGVNFRNTTTRTAQNIGDVTGWVYNRNDGDVEVVAEGEENDLKRLLDFLYKGPPAARVNDVDINWEEATGEFNSFRVRY